MAFQWFLIFFIFEEINERKKIEVADKYNSAVINYKKDNSYNVTPLLKEIINYKDKTYTPLAFFFLLENDLINSKNEIKSYQSVKEVRAILYKLGIDNFVRLTRLYWAKDKKISNISQWRALLAMGHSWKAPKLPIEAKDILLLGVPEGPLVGEILNEVENWWIDSDFIEDKASLFERIKAIVGAKI